MTTSQQPHDQAEDKSFHARQTQSLDTGQSQPRDGTEGSAAIDAPTYHEDALEADEALHRRGLKHLQAGEWEDAEECFSALMERHPRHEYYADLREQARLKAKLDESPPQRQRGHSLLRSRRVWFLTILNLMLWGFILGRQLYQQQIAPVLAQRQKIARQQQLINEGRQLLASGELDQAQERFQDVLALDTDNAAARRGLEEIRRRQQLAQTYEQATTYIEQAEWESALAALEAIRQEAPAYRDVQQQIDRVRKLRQWSDALSEAKQRFRSGNWQSAVEQLLLLRREAPDFKAEAVKDLLFKSYVKQGQAALLELGQDSVNEEIEQVQKAIDFLDKALEVNPPNSEAATQSELAKAYLAGLEAYSRNSWEQAGIHLASVYTGAADYAKGHAAELLQTAYVKIGTRSLHQAEYARAAEKYRQALALSLAGNARPLTASHERQVRTADNLIRQGRYRQAIVAYGDILRKMGSEAAASAVDQLEAKLARPTSTPTPAMRPTGEEVEVTPTAGETPSPRPTPTPRA